MPHSSSVSLETRLSDEGIAVLEAGWDIPDLTQFLSSMCGRSLVATEPDFLGEPSDHTPRKWLSHGLPSWYLPLHTDYPESFLPPKFVFLKCLAVGETPVRTVFYNIAGRALAHPLAQILMTEPWVTKDVANHGQIVRLLELDATEATPRIRLASNVLRPLFRSRQNAPKILLDIAGKSKSTSVLLQSGNMIVWDNWRALHGRQSGEVDEGWTPGPGRRLMRVKWYART